MELRQLRAFVAVADELHFGRAAARLYVSTSALSGQVQALERELGTRLFDRSSRRVLLTEVGRAFLVEVERTLADVEAARSAVTAVQGGGKRLRLGWPAVGNPAWVEVIYTDYRDTHPDVVLKPVVGHSAAHAQAVAEGKLDVAFVFGPQDASGAPLVFRLLRRLPLQLACAASHPLAAVPAVTVADLRAAAHVALPRDENPPLYRRVYEDLLAGATHLVEHATSLEAVLGIVATGDAVAIRVEDRLPAMTRQPVVYRPLTIPGLEVEFGVLRRGACRSPLAEAFCRYATTMTHLSDHLESPDGRPELRH